MKEFNYKRAWEEFVHPEFLKLSEAVHKAYQATGKQVDNIKQVGANHKVEGQTPDLVALFDAVPAEELAWASKVVYFHGHLSSGVSQSGGLYWKFEILADESVLRRGTSEDIRRAKERIDGALKAYHDHKEGTEYDNEELPGYLKSQLPDIAGAVEPVQADHVNHKPHPFVIGGRHFPKDGGMYINPRQAPCALEGCNLSYDEHTSERALFVRLLTKDEGVIKAALTKIIEFCKAQAIKLDGFAVVR